MYILECSDGSFYTGITTDLARRVAAHNAGRGARYTRSRRPVRVIYAESAGDRAAATRRERAIKRLPRAAKEALVRSGPFGVGPGRAEGAASPPVGAHQRST